MRIAYIIPKGRTMRKETWKALDSMMRKRMNEVMPEIESRMRNLMIYGTTHPEELSGEFHGLMDRWGRE